MNLQKKIKMLMTIKFIIKKYLLVILMFLLSIMIFGQQTITKAETNSGNNIFLPIITNNFRNGYSTNEKILGIYMQEYWTTEVVEEKMPQADRLAGKKHSISGWFIDIEDGHFNFPPHEDMNTHNLYRQLEALWEFGYISFININSQIASSYDIAIGSYDYQLHNLAKTYKLWIDQGDGRKAILAPLPEMNGVYSDGKAWASYGGDPENFKLAYQRILKIFEQNGIDSTDVWWSFAPNGWNDEEKFPEHAFENYYPGDNIVDVISFSSYNYGHCSEAYPWEKWENYHTLYKPYIERIFKLAPDKPIIIAQTGTTAQYSDTEDFNVDMKNLWLLENYDYISKQPQVLGILYYDFDQTYYVEEELRGCNWKISSPESVFSGYEDGAANPEFKYLFIQDLKELIP